MPSAGSTAPILATTRSNAGRVIANSTGPNNRCRPASVTDSATQFFPTSTATTTVDDDTDAATDTTHLRGGTRKKPKNGGPLHATKEPDRSFSYPRSIPVKDESTSYQPRLG